MTYPEVHMLTTFGGPLFQDEQWSMSLRSTSGFGDGGGFGSGEPVIPSPKAQAVSDAIRDWWSTTQAIEGPALLAWVKHNAIGVDGKYREPVTDEDLYTTGVAPGGGSGVNYPPQVSLVATLETGFTRGLASRGRIFLPCPAVTIQGQGLIPATEVATIATSVAALLSALNAVENFGQVSVISNTREGASRPVTGVTVGRVLDTMRSRRAQLSEERSPVSPVTGGS